MLSSVAAPRGSKARAAHCSSVAASSGASEAASARTGVIAAAPAASVAVRKARRSARPGLNVRHDR